MVELTLRLQPQPKHVENNILLIPGNGTSLISLARNDILMRSYLDLNMEK